MAASLRAFRCGLSPPRTPPGAARLARGGSKPSRAAHSRATATRAATSPARVPRTASGAPRRGAALRAAPVTKQPLQRATVAGKIRAMTKPTTPQVIATIALSVAAYFARYEFEQIKQQQQRDGERMQQLDARVAGVDKNVALLLERAANITQASQTRATR